LDPAAAGVILIKNEEKKMKIAVITDDGKTISRHFGRASYYLVATVENGNITDHEMRDKIGHQHFAADHQEEHHHGGQHGLDQASHDKHSQMAGSISDCQVLICGGMGMGAYESMKRLNIRPFVTDYQDVDEALLAYIAGNLIDHAEMLH
jgi:predicted Fe-Mo cluster-binding NifX family protein